MNKYLEQAKINANKSTISQIEVVIKQLNKENNDQINEDSSSEEEISDHYEDPCEKISEMEIDQDIVSHGIATGEMLLATEFGLENTTTEVAHSDKIIQNEGRESNSSTPKPNYLTKAEARLRASRELHENTSSDGEEISTPIAQLNPDVKREKVPTGMQSKPLIPRTPIPMEKLEQGKKENELIRQSLNIRLNEEAKIKKRKQIPEENKSSVNIGIIIGTKEI